MLQRAFQLAQLHRRELPALFAWLFVLGLQSRGSHHLGHLRLLPPGLLVTPAALVVPVDLVVPVAFVVDTAFLVIVTFLVAFALDVPFLADAAFVVHVVHEPRSPSSTWLFEILVLPRPRPVQIQILSLREKLARRSR